jgi:hypothetical protein
MNGSVDPNKHFVDEPAPAKPLPMRSQLPDKIGAELAAPQSHCFVADDRACAADYGYPTAIRSKLENHVF